MVIATFGPATGSPSTGTQLVQRSRRFPVWAIVLLAIVLVVVVVVIAIPLKPDQDAETNVAAVKEGISSIMMGIEWWAVEHNDVLPDPALVAPGALRGVDGRSSIERWPTNPYTGLPMTRGTGPGEFVYAVRPDGRSFTLVGYGEGGNAVISVDLGKPSPSPSALPAGHP